MRRRSDSAVLRRIESRMLISSNELQAAWNVPPHVIEADVQEERLFAIESPQGGIYFPAFYVETGKIRRQCSRSSMQKLGDLPGAAKYQFFTSRWLSLGRRTALRAIKEGSHGGTLKAAAAFTER